MLSFYAAQRSGALPADNSVIWRADSALSDGVDGAVTDSRESQALRRPRRKVVA